MGLLRGDELVADYLARLGEAAAELPAPDRTWLVESTRRRIRERAGAPGTRDEALVEVVLRELGEPAVVVAGVRRRTPVLTADAPPPANPPAPDLDDTDLDGAADAAPVPQGVTAVQTPSAPETDAPGTDALDDETEDAEDSDPDRTAPFPPLFADTDPHLVLPANLGAVRPAPAHVDAGPDLLTSLTGVRLELAALVALAVAPTVLGLVGFALAIGLVMASRFWIVRDKVAVTLGFSAAGLLLSIVAAWLSATQLQESDDPGTRISTAGHSLAQSLHALPAAIGWVAALYLGYVLVRDLNEHGRTGSR